MKFKLLKLFKKSDGENENGEEQKTTETKHYLTGKEVRAIVKANSKEMKRLEKYKNRRAPESAHTWRTPER